ncbi:LuxR C-terminal-related transcriptional regulator [Brachybacterium sp.]|uniref:LuxR C-terminal-related transcriptional regulator n=1 Tax=Brachybacterium sp. TaxID=1891286 RepID=UPI002ED126E9
MLHRRMVDALNSSAPLLFFEAVLGSGKWTVLRQWTDGADSDHNEIRLLFRAAGLPTTSAALTRMLWASLQHQLGHDLEDLPEDDALLEDAVPRGLRRIRRPVVVAIHGVEHLDHGAFDALVDLLAAGVRLILAGIDVSALRFRARRRGVYYSTLGDRETLLTLAETRSLIEEQGTVLSEEALGVLYAATLGHPGVILSCLSSLPVETAAGLLARDRALALHLLGQSLDQQSSDFIDFLLVAARVPRFTPAEAAELTGRDLAPRYLSRLLELSLGRMVWHPVLQERVFVWEESLRLVVRQSAPPPRGGEDELVEHLLSAARVAGDDELQIAALVRTGQLDEAESLLKEQVWDLLPNAMEPLWASLEQLSPLLLVDRPALLSARLRLSPTRSPSPASRRAVGGAGRVLKDCVDAGAPWRRMGSLVYSMEFALHLRERERVIALFERARGLLGDLVASDAAESAGNREISELLLLVEIVFRSGNTIPAAEIAQLAAQLIEADPVGRDPRGERLAFARRVILHDHRARGLEDGFSPESLLRGPELLWRDADLVVTAMTLMWDDLDGGDFAAADAQLHAAAVRIDDPEEWPILMLMRAHIAVYRNSPGELEAFIGAFERGTLSEPGPFAQQSLSRMQRVTDYLGRKVGRAIPSPGYLPATADGSRPFYPRTEFTVHLMEALYALRAGRPDAAEAALSQAVGLTPRRELGLYTLASASGEEVRALCALAEEVPGGARLGIEKALRFAGETRAPGVDLSEREREVLGHLRDGATNPQMARALFVSVNTVKFHRANLMRKLGVTSRDQLLQKADRLGL